MPGLGVGFLEKLRYFIPFLEIFLLIFAFSVAAEPILLANLYCRNSGVQINSWVMGLHFKDFEARLVVENCVICIDY